VRGATAVDQVRAVTTEATLWCMPLQGGLFAPPVDASFDRNRCSGLHAGELVRVLRVSDDWVYANSGYSVGWLRASLLTPPLSHTEARGYLRGGDRLVLVGDHGSLRMGMDFRILAETAEAWTISFPGAGGLVERSVPRSAPASRGFLPFTRRNVWRLALSQLGRPYGWGGRAGERDCSRLLMDVFKAFGLRLGRHSSYQSRNGAATLELAGLDEHARRQAIERAHQRGVVLLYMKGHILLLLGRDERGLYGVSSISEYLRPCDGGGHRVVRLDRVAVTDLELGRGTERTAFVERLVRGAVFAP
jgi:hypothetical protein